MKVINIKQKLSQYNEYWSPKIVGVLNDDKVQVVKLKGEFVWHKHDIEEELFYVVKGKLFWRSSCLLIYVNFHINTKKRSSDNKTTLVKHYFIDF